MRKRSVLVVEPDSVRREELVAAISSAPDLRVVGEGTYLEEACKRNSSAQQVDVLLIDIGGPEAIRTEWWALIHALLPGVPVVAVGEDLSANSLLTALGGGVIACQLLGAPPSVLHKSVRRAARGIPYFDQYLADQMKKALLVLEGADVAGGAQPPASRDPTKAEKAASAAGLTSREWEVLRLVGQGLRNREIGILIHLSDKTVRNCVSVVLGKLGVRSRTEAAVWLTTRVDRGEG